MEIKDNNHEVKSDNEVSAVLRKYDNFDEQQFYNRYADEIEADLNRREQQSNNNNGTEENDSTREEQRHDRGNQVQSGQRTDDDSGSEGGKDSEGEVRTRDEGSDESEAALGSGGSTNQQRIGRVQKETRNDVANEPMSHDEAIAFIAAMENRAEVAPSVDLSIENWDALFGKDGLVNTPIGEVKMGDNQFTKMMRQGRNGKLGMIKPTLETPDLIIEENSEAKDGDVAERNSSYIFIKAFIKKDGSRFYYFTSISVSKGGKEVIISSQEKSRNKILRLMEEESVIWRTPKDATTPSAERQGLDYEQPEIAETTAKGSGITPQSTSSDGKGKDISDSVQENGDKSSENEGEKNLSAQIEDASADVNTDPTEAQKEAGNYKKGHVHVGSFDITIEQPQGSVRKGTDANGKHWESKMNNTYGYFRGTEGVDGDHIDVFLSNDIDGWNRQTVFVVDQYNPDGSFDEHKVMLGFNNAEEAKRDYLANYEKGWENSRRIDVSAVNLADFEKWIASSHRKTKPFSEYSSVKKESSASSETKQSKSTAEEKPFNAIIEMLHKKFPDASMEALTAADRLLREQALPGERQKAIEAVAKALGLKVEWRDTMEKENGTFNPKTRTITIARDSEHALADTFGHEVTHAVRNLSEADYKNLKDAVRRLYSSEKEYNEAVQAYGDMYTGLDFDALEEELIADNIGFMIGGRNDMTQELASRMNHRVLWAIHDAMNKVRNALANVLHIDSKKNGLLEALDSARATIRETMANAQRIAKEKGQGLSNESGSARQSLRTQDSASEFAEKHGVAADNVRQYAEGIKSGNLQKADWALSEIRRTMRVANRGMKLSEFGKLFRPIQNELAERYGDIERLRQEYIDAEMRERNLMETARKKAEEEERNRQERLEELSLLGDAEVDKRYMDALKRGDEATAREMLDEAARRKGYGDAESDYQGEGAWAAPSNPGYKSADERRADLENNTIFNVEDMALGYSAQPEDYFKYPKRYAQDTPHGRESTQSIQKAIEAVKRGEKDVKVKVYRAVPTSVKEGKLRNGDWVTPSKKYAEMHGNSRLEGKYRIIEDEVPVDELWWDGNDANEWGYDNGKGYKYKNVKNNRKSDDLVTRDDKGNVIPPSKRFNQRKADERYHKFGMPIKPNSAEVALRDALVERMRLSGMDVISDEAGQRVLDEANGKVREMSFGEAYDYDAYPLGRVEPNLAEKEVAVVEADVNHGFANYKEAKAWAKQHVSKVYNNEESGGKGEVRISNAAIDKFMSQSAIDKSDSKDVHMAVLKVLPEVLKSSIDVETHPDFLKGEDGKRRAENGMNKDVLVHRCYGAVSIDGKPYRVKITLKEEVRNKKLPHNTHSYEATKIELLAGQHGDVTMTSPRNSNSSKQVEQSAGTLVKPKGDNPNTNNSISAAKLLENVGMSYNSGEKVLDASKKRSEGLREQRVWHGSGAEFDAFDHSHMGSGEGLQIHGYGTYVSVSQGMAEGYARKLSDDEGSSYLYRVEIPDNTGYNYLEEGGTYTPDDVVRQKVDAVLKEKGLKSLGDENLTGRKLYREVQNRANGKKAASELLSESGLKGVHYFGRADGECYVIFNEKDVKITDHVRFFRTANGEAYGFTVGGRIYIDPRIATSETPVHEYAHLWATALKSANAKEWQNVVGLMKGTKVWDEVKALYPELKSDDEIADEVLATYSGRRGAERLREEQRRIAKGNGSVFEKAEAISALESVKQALKRFWKGVADFLHIHYTSAEEVADRVMKDLLDGVDPRSMMDGGRSLRHDTRINVVEGNTEHGFKNYAEAKDWAKEKIARTYNSEETGGKGDIRISNAAINKYLSQSAVDKSDSKDVHLSVLKVLPEVIRESVDAEQHADFKKGEDGVRSAENGINPNVTIHRLYGAVRMGGRLYRVKVTLKEDKTSKEPKVPHSYEATKIELFAGTLGNSDNSLSPNTNNSITAAKLLKGVEKSYGGGKFFEDYNKVREQFIGEQGAERADHAEEVTTRIDNLNVAREMEDAKKDAKAIKLATGWERGADGKWRYEIPDLKYFGKGDAGYKKARGKQPWSKELDGLSDKIFDGEELSESEYKRFDELAQKEDDFKTDYLNREKPHLADWVENDELFKAYPDLKRVNVVFNDQLPANHGGSYNEREHTIVVNTNYVGDIDSVLAHEVQHAIQRIEGFARGSNTDYIDSIKETIDDIKNLFLESLNRIAEIRGIPTFDEWFSSLDENAMLKVGDSIPYYFKRGQFHGFDVYYYYYVDNIGFNESDKKKIKAKLEKADNAISKENKILGGHYNRRSFDLYETIAGEVESRNVEKRMKMSPEERRASLAAETEDVSREDQIFLFGEGGTSMKTSSDLNEMFGNPKTNGMTVSDMKRKVADLFEKAHTGEFKGKPQRVGRLSRKGKAYLEKLSGLQFKEYVDFVLNPSDLNHIRGDHYGRVFKIGIKNETKKC